MSENIDVSRRFILGKIGQCLTFAGTAALLKGDTTQPTKLSRKEITAIAKAAQPEDQLTRNSFFDELNQKILEKLEVNKLKDLLITEIDSNINKQVSVRDRKAYSQSIKYFNEKIYSKLQNLDFKEVLKDKYKNIKTSELKSYDLEITNFIPTILLGSIKDFIKESQLYIGLSRGIAQFDNADLLNRALKQIGQYEGITKGDVITGLSKSFESTQKAYKAVETLFKDTQMTLTKKTQSNDEKVETTYPEYTAKEQYLFNLEYDFAQKKEILHNSIKGIQESLNLSGSH